MGKTDIVKILSLPSQEIFIGFHVSPMYIMLPLSLGILYLMLLLELCMKSLYYIFRLYRKVLLSVH